MPLAIKIIIEFSKPNLFELNVEYILEIYVTLKLIDDLK
jgi:hypothetical protein